MSQFEAPNLLKMRYDEFIEIVPEKGFVFGGNMQENIADVPKLIALVNFIEENISKLTPDQVREFRSRIVKLISAVRNLYERSEDIIPKETKGII